MEFGERHMGDFIGCIDNTLHVFYIHMDGYGWMDKALEKGSTDYYYCKVISKS